MVGYRVWVMGYGVLSMGYGLYKGWATGSGE